jgi:hypothetical protein
MARKSCSFVGFLLAALAAASLTQMLKATPGQQAQISVAEASRKAREEKKNRAPASKIYTDEDIPNLKGTVSVVGQLPPPAAATTDKAANGTTPAAPAGGATGATGVPAATTGGTPAAAAAAPVAAVKDETYWRKAFADARKKLADDSKELDVLQREFNLKQQQYYSDPNVALQQQYTNKDLDDTRQEIDAKKQVVDQDNQAIAGMEDDLRKAGGDAGWAR